MLERIVGDKLHQLDNQRPGQLSRLCCVGADLQKFSLEQNYLQQLDNKRIGEIDRAPEPG
jgi:hypothetical protein